MALRPFLSAILTLALLSGCAKSRVEQLTERADAYNRSLRWSSLTAASALMAEEARRTLLEQLSRELNTDRIVEYSILDLGLDPDKKRGSVVVEFSYYNVSDGDLRYRQEIQSWRYDSKKKKWFIDGVRKPN